jgi:hypothetical protein
MSTNGNDLIQNVPLPAGAEKVYDWHDVGTDDEGRFFCGRSWVIEGAGWHRHDIRVFIQGIQRPTGEVERVIAVGELHPDIPITAAQARQLGRALIAAADEMDSLSDPAANIG